MDAVIKEKSFFLKIQINICFFTFTLCAHQAWAKTCYDITTNHKCPQENTQSVKTDSFSNEILKTRYKMWSSAKALLVRQDCNTGSSSERNIVDIYKVIEQAQLDEREKFVCEMAVQINEQMRIVLNDREFIKSYIAKKKSNTFISEQDKVKMTSLLMRYRLLRNKNSICGVYATKAGDCYFSSARFEVPSEVFVEINETAAKYVSTFGAPDKCLLNGREYSLTSSQCEKEIFSRVQVIPPPLILAQAAQESGWGNKDNKWVTKYNNYLGLQIKFSQPPTMACYKNCRCSGTNNARCALQFKDVAGCLYEYSMRFNASPLKAYKAFRKTRGKLQNMGSLNSMNAQCKNARVLIPHLKHYAEEKRYVHYICDRLNDNICTMLKKCPKYQSI